MVFKEAEIEGILMINLASLSEVTLSIPVARALKVNYPNAKITMLVNAKAKDIVEMIPYVDAVAVYDQEGEHQGISGFISLVNTIRGSAFDLAVAMNLTLREPLIAWAAGIKYRVGYEGRYNKIFLTHVAAEDEKRVQHQAIAYLQVLLPLKITTADTSLELKLDDKSEKIVDITMLCDTKRPNIVFCPFNLHRPHCSLSEEKALLITGELMRFSNVYLIGGVKEQPVLHKVAEQAGLPQESVLAGRLNLKEVAVFLKYVKVMVTVEACTMHMAQSLNLPVVALFGPTSPLIYGPCGNRDVTLTHKVNCWPCGAKEKCLHSECIEEIPIEEIIDKIVERME